MTTVYRPSQTEEQRPPSVLELLEKTRVRPALFLGERSISALWHFLHGYHLGLLGNPSVSTEWTPLSKEFHDWVAYRLHFLESTMGWRNMVLKRFPEEAAALDTFFRLFDEYRVRSPRTVARLEGLEQKYTEISNGKERVCPFPSTLVLVSYTEDPGFFVHAESGETRFPGQGFTPFIKWFETDYQVNRNRLKVLDSAAYQRWLSEEDRPRK